MEKISPGPSQLHRLRFSQKTRPPSYIKDQNKVFGATENFLVAREFDRIATREQKIALLHCLYAVSSADKSISAAEDHEIREISRELKLDHSDYIDVRLAFREYLSVLKNPPDSES